MRGLTFEKPKKRYSLSECYANFLTILRIYRTTMIFFLKMVFLTLNFQLTCNLLTLQTENVLCNPQNPVNPDSEPSVSGKFHP